MNVKLLKRNRRNKRIKDKFHKVSFLYFLFYSFAQIMRYDEFNPEIIFALLVFLIKIIVDICFFFDVFSRGILHHLNYSLVWFLLTGMFLIRLYIHRHNSNLNELLVDLNVVGVIILTYLYLPRLWRIIFKKT